MGILLLCLTGGVLSEAKPKDAQGNILANLKNAFHSAASSRNQKIHREEAKIAKMEKSFSTKDTNKYEAFKVIPPLRVLTCTCSAGASVLSSRFQKIFALNANAGR